MGLDSATGPYEDLNAFLTDAGQFAQSLLDQGISGMKIWPFDRYAKASLGPSITPGQLDEGLEPLRELRQFTDSHYLQIGCSRMT